MRRHTTLRTTTALAAAVALLAACSEDPSSASSDGSNKDSDDTSASSHSSPTQAETSSPADATEPTDTEPADGVLTVPEPDAGQDYATLSAGRYRIPLDDTLAFEVDLPAGTSAHDDGLFLALDDFVLKTELAGDGYGVPQDPCSGRLVSPAGARVADLVDALADLPVYETTRPEAVKVGGAEGSYLEARIPRSYDAASCEGGAVPLPANPGTAVGGPPPYVGRWFVLDVDGRRVVLQQNCWGCTADQLDRDAGVIKSITFTPSP